MDDGIKTRTGKNNGFLRPARAVLPPGSISDLLSSLTLYVHLNELKATLYPSYPLSFLYSGSNKKKNLEKNGNGKCSSLWFLMKVRRLLTEHGVLPQVSRLTLTLPSHRTMKGFFLPHLEDGLPGET